MCKYPKTSISFVVCNALFNSVDKTLVEVVKAAISLTKVDFGVTYGLRTL